MGLVIQIQSHTDDFKEGDNYKVGYDYNFDFTDDGLQCDTPCGQDGLVEGRYWCYTADYWGFCDPQELYQHYNGPPKQDQDIHDSNKIMPKISTKYEIPRMLFIVIYFGLLALVFGPLLNPFVIDLTNIGWTDGLQLNNVAFG